MFAIKAIYVCKELQVAEGPDCGSEEAPDAAVASAASSTDWNTSKGNAPANDRPLMMNPRAPCNPSAAAALVSPST